MCCALTRYVPFLISIQSTDAVLAELLLVIVKPVKVLLDTLKISLTLPVSNME